jgi:hypothetical protein
MGIGRHGRSLSLSLSSAALLCRALALLSIWTFHHILALSSSTNELSPIRVISWNILAPGTFCSRTRIEEAVREVCLFFLPVLTLLAPITPINTNPPKNVYVMSSVRAKVCTAQILLIPVVPRQRRHSRFGRRLARLPTGAGARVSGRNQG